MYLDEAWTVVLSDKLKDFFEDFFGFLLLLIKSRLLLLVLLLLLLSRFSRV